MLPTSSATRPYYPTAHPITSRVTGDTASGRLLGAQLVGRRGTEVVKRIDTFATAIHHEMTVDAMSELDLSYTPPLGSPWDAVQMASQSWVREHQLVGQRQALHAPLGASPEELAAGGQRGRRP